MTFGKCREDRNAVRLAGGPLFIVGMWRSGASLLYALLNKHPQVGLMFEADLALLQPLFLKPRKQDWLHRWEFWNQALSRHRLRAEDVSAEVSEFRDAFVRVHQRYAGEKGATIWGDKSPNYYDRLNQMADLFPDAHFIIVWRDPADIIGSIIRAGQAGSAYFGRKGSALRGLLGYQALRSEHDGLVARGKAVLQVNYEDLVHQTPAVMHEVCGFLEIPYTDGLCSLQGADRSAIFDDSSKHHALVKGDQIVAGGRPDAVPVGLRNKIARYDRLWRGPSGVGVGRLEQFADRLRYRALRAYDRATALGFCFLPMFLLHWYRAWKYGERVEHQLRRQVPARSSVEVNS